MTEFSNNIKREHEDFAILSKALLEQYGAAIKMLERIMNKCPEKTWNDRSSGPPFWQVSYHAMHFLDWYLGSSKEEREEFQKEFKDFPHQFDRVPEEILTRKQLINYLSQIKKKTKKRLENISVSELMQPSVFEWHGNSVLSSLMYNLRHVMVHIGALSSKLHRIGVDFESWVSKAPI